MLAMAKAFGLAPDARTHFVFSKGKLQLLTSIHSVFFRLHLSLVVSWHYENWGKS